MLQTTSPCGCTLTASGLQGRRRWVTQQMLDRRHFSRQLFDRLFCCFMHC